MKNKKNRANLNKTAQPPQKKTIGLSRIGIKLIVAGVAVVASGYLVLSKADPSGQNWASTLSPFLLLGGYALIGIGIAFPDKSASANGNIVPSADNNRS